MKIKTSLILDDYFLYSHDVMFDQVVILLGEIRCLASPGFRGLMKCYLLLLVR